MSIQESQEKDILQEPSGSDSAPPPPIVRGLPILGSALDFLNRPIELFLDAYYELGPIYRVNALNQSFVVMAGLEANRLLAQHGEDHFTSEPLFGEFAEQMGSSNFLVALDGEPHRHMRKVMQRGYSKGNMAIHLDEMATLTAERARSWGVGTSLPVRDTLQRLVTEQLGQALTNHSSEEQFENIRIYLNTLLNVLTIKRWPRVMLLSPRYLRAKASVMEFSRQVLEEHRQNRGEREPDLIDDLLAAVDWNGDPLSEDDLLAATIGPYFAGMDTVASTMGFMLYAILSDPEIEARVVAEVDEYFADGVPPWRELPKLEALYGATIETLRRYPVAPFTPRGVTKGFEFAGHQVRAGEDVLIANSLTHFLPEFFPEPFEFDIDRYKPPRNEHRQGLGVFAPYTLGPHTCLGAGAAELQLMVTVGALLRTVRLQLDPPDYELKVKLTPIPSPDTRFRVKVIGYRGTEATF